MAFALLSSRLQVMDATQQYMRNINLITSVVISLQSSVRNSSPKVTPCSRVFLQNASNMSAKLINSLPFMKPGGSLPNLQEPATGESHEPDESSHVHTATSYFLKTDLNIILIFITSFPNAAFPSIISTKSVYAFFVPSTSST